MGWSGSCIGVVPNCVLAVDTGGIVQAQFGRPTTVELLVSGGGTVVSSPAGIACGVGGAKCVADFEFGSRLVVRARPRPGYAFVGWSDLRADPDLPRAKACGARHTLVCVFSPRRWMRVGAMFRRLKPQPGLRLLSVVAHPVPSSIRESELMKSVPAGIRCPLAIGERRPPTSPFPRLSTARCRTVPAGTLVSLQTRDEFGAQWRGACVGVAIRCALIADSELTVTARVHFEAHHAVPDTGVGVNVTVSGAGTVTDGHRIRCGVAAQKAADCRAFFKSRQVVVLKGATFPPSPI
jgi:hypothetical protein